MIRRWFLYIPLLVLLGGLVLGCSSDESDSTDEIAAIPVEADELAQLDDSTAAGRSENQASSATIDAVLVRSISESGLAEGFAEEAPRSFFNGPMNLFLLVDHQQETPTPFVVRWYALDTDGNESEIGTWRHEDVLSPFEPYVLERNVYKGKGVPPTPGYADLAVGQYIARIDVDGLAPVEVPFEIIYKHPVATLLSALENKPQGFNIALSALGGAVIAAPDPTYGSTSLISPKPIPPVRAMMCSMGLGKGCEQWSAHNVIDGLTPRMVWRGGTETDCRSCGWRIWESELPAQLIIKLPGEKPTTIDTIVLDPGSQRENNDSRYRNVAIPRYIEIATSTSSNVNEFVVVATAALQPLLEPQLVKFDPVEASHVRVTVIDAHTGEREIVLDEIQVFEVPGGDSVVDESVLNLASPDLGGVFVQASSGAWKLVDGTAGEIRWSTKAEFPIDLVLAFREDRQALVKSVMLYNKKAKTGSIESWPKGISVAVSSETPASGFREIGRFEALAVEGKQTFPVNAQARYLRLRINSNHGGDDVSLDELWIFEGQEQGYDSILAAYPSKVSALRHRAVELPPTGHTETEPNDEFSDASNLVFGELNLGVIDSPTDVDHYRIPSVPAGPLALTLEITGYPDIRTYVALFDPDGEQIAQFNPGETTNDLYRATWHLSKPGEYGLKVSRAPMSMVIAVGGKLDSYEADLKGLLDNLKAPDEVTVIRSSKKGAEYLLPDFTSDVAEVMAAIKVETSLAAKLYTDDHDFWKELAASNIRKYGVSGSQGAEIYEEENIGIRHGLYAAGELLNTRPGNRVYMGLGGVNEVTGQSSVLYATTTSRISQHIVTTTGGQIFRISSENEAEGAYREIMDYLRSAARYGLSAKLSSLKGTLEVQATGERIPSVSGPSQVALILDASGSMKRRMGDRRMIDIAKDVLGKVIQGIPDESLVALRVFGHRINEGLPGDCQDTEALVPFSRINRADMRSKLSLVDASGGTTLIGHTLRQLSSDFDSAPGPKLVVLVTDGEEECEPDLQGVITALQARGIDMQLNIVGFALGDENVKQSMAELADLSGGRFFDAKDAASLELSVARALDVPYRVVDSNGEQVATGSIDGGPIEVLEGEYSIVVDMTDQNLKVVAVRILADQVTKIELNKDGQEVGINIREPSPLQSDQ